MVQDDAVLSVDENLIEKKKVSGTCAGGSPDSRPPTTTKGEGFARRSTGALLATARRSAKQSPRCTPKRTRSGASPTKRPRKSSSSRLRACGSGSAPSNRFCELDASLPPRYRWTSAPQGVASKILAALP